MNILRDCEIDFRARVVGRTELGYRLLDPADDTEIRARALFPVVNLPAGSSRYNADDVPFPYGTDDVVIEWDDPATGLMCRELIDFQIELAGGGGGGGGGDGSGLTLLDALHDLCAGDDDLTDVFGRSAGGEHGWLWRDEAPRGEENPVAVMILVGPRTTHESLDADGDIPTTGEAEVQIDVYADTQAQAVALGDAVTAAVQDASLVFGTSEAIDFRRINRDEPPSLEEERGRDGQDVWRQLLRFRAMVAGGYAAGETLVSED